MIDGRRAAVRLNRLSCANPYAHIPTPAFISYIPIHTHITRIGRTFQSSNSPDNPVARALKLARARAVELSTSFITFFSLISFSLSLRVILAASVYAAPVLFFHFLSFVRSSIHSTLLFNYMKVPFHYCAALSAAVVTTAEAKYRSKYIGGELRCLVIYIYIYRYSGRV